MVLRAQCGSFGPLCNERDEPGSAVLGSLCCVSFCNILSSGSQLRGRGHDCRGLPLICPRTDGHPLPAPLLPAHPAHPQTPGCFFSSLFSIICRVCVCVCVYPCECIFSPNFPVLGSEPWDKALGQTSRYWGCDFLPTILEEAGNLGRGSVAHQSHLLLLW